MKEITISSSRIQYTSDARIAHGYETVVLYGKAALSAVRECFERKKKPIRNKIRSLRQTTPDSGRITDLELEILRYNDRINRIDENNLKVTIVTPHHKWMEE